MLRKDLDFVPLSPKKVTPPVAEESKADLLRAHKRGKSQSKSRSRLGSESGCEDDISKSDWEANGLPRVPEQDVKDERNTRYVSDDREKIRSTDKKKELLGTMLGNVEALVEGVRKAGVWGLG